MKRTFFLGIILALFVAGDVRALSDERILSFESDIIINDDASLIVTETIEVRAEGDKIQRGIYRDFPTVYTDRFDTRTVVSFELLDVRKDGVTEPYRTQRQSNGVRIYVGEEDVFLVPGEYTYTIRYQTAQQIGFFDEHDELYWNVTGNDWIFPIDVVTATITLPGGIAESAIQTAAFTGVEGATGEDYQTYIELSGAVRFTTTRSLAPGEGFTVVVGWPKGFVEEPSASEKLRASLLGNIRTLLVIAVVVLLLLYYLIVWFKVGRDPRKSSIIARYEPPHGLSPAGMRYLLEMGADDRTFSAAVLSMAVKGAVVIQEEKKRFFGSTYALIRGQTDALLLLEEREVHKALFGGVRDKVELKDKNHEIISNAIEKLKKSLKSQFGKNYFTLNSFYRLPGIALLLIVVGMAIYDLMIAFSGTGVFGFPLLSFLSAIAALLINLVFYFLMRAPTRQGRAFMDAIEGFKLFLSVTEKDRLAFHNPPDKTPEVFERFLPYALALEVEHEWAEQFSDVLARAKEVGKAYAPTWYVGPSWDSIQTGKFTSTFGSALTSAISSSSTPPGSSSGFGGGSSGGGGGGGGGGGW